LPIATTNRGNWDLATSQSGYSSLIDEVQQAQLLQAVQQRFMKVDCGMGASRINHVARRRLLLGGGWEYLKQWVSPAVPRPEHQQAKTPPVEQSLEKNCQPDRAIAAWQYPGAEVQL